MGQNNPTKGTLFAVRPATESDILTINAIYAYYVLHTVLTFKWNPATPDQVLEDFKSIKQEGLPYLVATEEVSDTVVGYCYASRFRPSKRGYRPTVELSIFCSPVHLSKGIGSLLLSEIIRLLKQPDEHESTGIIGQDGKDVGVGSLVACMAVDEFGPDGGMALKRFYERFGFEQAGHLKAVGYKFGRWIDTIYMQLSLK